MVGDLGLIGWPRIAKRPRQVGVASLAVMLFIPLVRAQVDWRVEGPVVRPARRGAAMVYDVVRGAFVAFGGVSTGASGDAATFRLDGSGWHARQPATVPPGRSSHVMAYDLARGRVVMFGGQGTAGLLSDTWEWDGVDWSFVATSVQPVAREAASMCYDLARTRSLLFGGRLANNVRSDELWEWDGVQWQPHNVLTRPSARSHSAMVYDALRQRAVLFGGYANLPMQDTWEWDGSTWNRRTTSIQPLPRSGHAMAYDQGRQRTVLFGGMSPSSVDYADHWEWDGTSWSLLQQMPSRVQPRDRHTMAYDLANQRVLMAGGYGPAYEDLWQWDGAEWSPLGAHRPGSVGRNQQACYDLMRHRGVLVAHNGRWLETWEWDAGTWNQRFPATSPPERVRYGFAYDSDRQRVVMFGGGALLTTTMFADTWEWDGLTWTQKQPMHAPTARFGVMAYDSVRRETVLVGNENYVPVFETWGWDGTDWRQHTSAITPTARMLHGAAFDAHRGRLVVFGGTGVDQPVVRTLDDTWEWDGVTWRERLSLHRPPANTDASLHWDPVRDRCVLVRANAQQATFEWDGVDWVARVTATPHPGIMEATGFFDPALGRIVVYYSVNLCWSYGTDQPAAADRFGAGCSGSVGEPKLRVVAGRLPWLGRSMELTLEPVPPNAPLLAVLGFTNSTAAGQSLPVALDGFGLPGCELYTSVDRFVAFQATGARGDLALAVPATPAVAGLQFYCQGVVLDPAANAGGLVLTDALACTVGVP